MEASFPSGEKFTQSMLCFGFEMKTCGRHEFCSRITANKISGNANKIIAPKICLCFAVTFIL